MKVLIEAINTPTLWKVGGATAKLRIEALRGFTTSDGQFVPPSTDGSFYLEVPITITGESALIPSFEVDSTEDAFPWDSQVTGDVPGYKATIITSTGRRFPYFPQFKIPILTDGDPSYNWNEIRIFNRAAGKSVYRLQRYILEDEARQWITSAVGALNKSSELNPGVTALSTDPLDPTFPIAISETDPRWQNLITNPFTDIFLNVKDFGAVGDGITDDTAAIQAAIDSLDNSNVNGTIFFPPGVYIVAGPLLDTGNSNAQILLPRRTDAMLSIRLSGVAPAPTIAFKRDNQGAILKSTLTSGNGRVIGGKVGGGLGWPVAGTSWCSVAIENLTIRLVANPTNSGVDLTYYPNSAIRNVQVSTDEDVITATGFPPTIGITEPTTTSSFGIKLAPGNIPDQTILDNVEVYGFYTGIISGELINADNVLVVFCKVGVEVPGALHAQRFGRLYISDCAKRLLFTGSESYIEIEQLSMEHNSTTPAWAQVTVDIDDPNNYGHGLVRWHLTTDGTVVNDLTQNGAFFLWTESVSNLLANHSTSPMVQVTRSSDQSIPNSSFTNVDFDTEISDDPFNIHSVGSNPHRFTPTKEGEVLIDFCGRFASNATGLRQVLIWKHTPAGGGAEVLLKRSNIIAITEPGADTTVNLTVKSRATLPGDYFYVQVWQNSGGALDLIASSQFSPLQLDSPTVFFSQKR